MSRDLIAHARRLLDPSVPSHRYWPRAVALLTRQALEEALSDLWRNSRYPDMAKAGWSSQLSCLSEILSERNRVDDARMAWASLSRACHHHHYELDPTVAELNRWIEQTERLIPTPDVLGTSSEPAAG